MAPAQVLRSLALFGASAVASAFTAGCLITDMRYDDPVGSPTTVGGATSCLNLCANSAACFGFTYYPNSNECYFSRSGNNTHLVRRNVGTEPRMYSGPKTCASPPTACPVSITGTWPGATAAASDAVFSTGYQPQSLQCWPKFSYNGSYATCAEVAPTVLDDMNSGWAGKCLGLTQKTLGVNQTCESTCLADALCPGYQVGSDGSCWQGIGKGCYGAAPWNDTWFPTAAKRYRRGEVLVIKQIVGVQILGLQQIFDQEDMNAMPNLAVRSTQCKKACESVLSCQYWQLHNETGCWIELPDSPVEYPLTQNSVKGDTVDAPKFIAGEYIQHSCLPVPSSTTIWAPTLPAPTFPPSTTTSTTTTTTTTTEAAGGFPWWGWLLLALLLCCLLGAIAAAFMMCGGKKAKKPKKTTRKARPPQVPAQPVPTVMTAVPVYSAPQPQPQPVYTYAAAPPTPAPMYDTRAAPIAMSAPQPVMTAQPSPPPMMNFDRMDQNHDGVITRAEFQQAMMQR